MMAHSVTQGGILRYFRGEIISHPPRLTNRAS